jgi:hypothetical protein
MNLDFQKQTIGLCKSKRASNKAFAQIKMLASNNKKAISTALNTESINVPTEWTNFHRRFKSALNDTVTYYSAVIDICGDPKSATFGTLMSTAQSAKNKYSSCAENYNLTLEPKIPKDLFLTPGDKLSLLIKNRYDSEFVVIPPKRSFTVNSGQSPYISAMQNIINRYGNSRDVLQKFCDWVRQRTTDDTVFTFCNQLNTCLEVRRQLMREAESLSPSIGYDYYHQEFISILNQAILATSYAAEYIGNPNNGNDYWQKFQALSADISRRMPAVARAYNVRW